MVRFLHFGFSRFVYRDVSRDLLRALLLNVSWLTIVSPHFLEISSKLVAIRASTVKQS